MFFVFWWIFDNMLIHVLMLFLDRSFDCKSLANYMELRFPKLFQESNSYKSFQFVQPSMKKYGRIWLLFWIRISIKHPMSQGAGWTSQPCPVRSSYGPRAPSKEKSLEYIRSAFRPFVQVIVVPKEPWREWSLQRFLIAKKKLLGFLIAIFHRWMENIA